MSNSKIHNTIQNVSSSKNLGLLIAILIAVAYGYLVSKYALVGLSLFAIMLSIFLGLVCLVDTRIGFFINLFYSFFIFHFSRLFFNDKFPVGIVYDLLVLVTFVSLFIRRIPWKEDFSAFVKHPIVFFILVLFAYLLLELFNPFAGSFDGWVQTIRKVMGSVLLMFISFIVFKDKKAIRSFFAVLFVLLVVVGIYGCIQQWHGLFDFEKFWVMSDNVRFGLLFINGDFRKFSTTSDASSFGIIMAAGAILYLILSISEKSVSKKVFIWLGVLVMLLGMAYSGTRTAYATFFGGIGMYILLSFDKKSTRILAFLSIIVLLLIIYLPYYGSPTVNRLRSTFIGRNDKSYEVREINRKMIQPYIHNHPIGGGLGTTGGSGMRNNSSHYLAGFPTDSGYLKKALETGWIGLAIICLLYYYALKTGARGYFRARKESIKFLYSSITCSLFSFYLAEVPQEAIGHITDIIIYYPLLALLIQLDQQCLRT